jgi:acetylornithine deacetylase/succinyl-diaminopimelate desuccinylase-like protein
VPDKFTFRFDRRLTVGEAPAAAVAAVEKLPAVAAAREAGLHVEVGIPRYTEPTWKGYQPGNEQTYMGWETPEEHPAIQAAVEAYDRVVAPTVESSGPGGSLKKTARVDRWIFSTDGVGFPIPIEGSGVAVSERKNWVRTEEFWHPPMFGFGPGIEQNTHKIGEVVDLRELQRAVAMMARFPTVYAGRQG